MKTREGRNGGTILVAEKGETTNPKGRPKGARNRSTIAREFLKLRANLPDATFEQLKGVIPDLDKNIDIEGFITLSQIAKAISDKDTGAYKAVMDSAYGAPKQEVEHSGDQDNPVVINITKTYATKSETD